LLSSRRRHTTSKRDWSSDVWSSYLITNKIKTTTIMSKNSNSLFTFLLGAGMGAVVGVLFAPDTGNNTRDRLSYQLVRYKEELEEIGRASCREGGSRGVGGACV